jgi:hypothetical protein
LCLEQYLLSEALASAPPLLVIIGGEVPQAVIDHSPVAGHDYQLAAAVTDSPDNHWGHAATATLAPRVPTIRTGRHARKREPNAILLMFSVLGGGVLSLVLAPLILWWIFKVDPVEIGPPVAVYAPWVVPQQFHGSPAPRNVNSEPVLRPAKRRSNKAPAEKSPETDRSSATSDSQTAPNQDDAPAASTSDSPEIRFKPIEPQPATKDADTHSERVQPKPPMPDLTDLLP